MTKKTTYTKKTAEDMKKNMKMYTNTKKTKKNNKMNTNTKTKNMKKVHTIRRSSI